MNSGKGHKERKKKKNIASTVVKKQGAHRLDRKKKSPSTSAANLFRRGLKKRPLMGAERKKCTNPFSCTYHFSRSPSNVPKKGESGNHRPSQKRVGGEKRKKKVPASCLLLRLPPASPYAASTKGRKEKQKRSAPAAKYLRGSPSTKERKKGGTPPLSVSSVPEGKKDEREASSPWRKKKKKKNPVILANFF